ncbi:GNAT family N-acetyltransferase [Mucilaginibacter sp. X4EP1]|uniref:GNAT family N-acetyltransferase n=1 Tax=Mucilaginibacter sp. X4EP1 TaxID=2723092 RepID=UPI0021690B9B|nr:GNAT family N-acetyltransferase [Mucilaginibacter sp. X4EP1]MCS3815493.1 GNAT superfamily N-acetyltransferase [Mucilaginibacter sp. X4EP1]
MPIRNATYKDAPAIRILMEALGYKTSISLLISQLENLFDGKDHQAYVYELNKEVVGFVSVHYLPQLAFDGGVMVITYLSVDETVKNINIAGELEQYITSQARLRKCERIQVHCAEWRAPAQQFYLQQGYQDYPRYFTKRLMYGE